MTTQSSVSAHNPWSQQNATIESVTPESAGVATYDIAIGNATIASEYRFQPGQFNMLYLPGVGEAAISLSGDPHQHGSLRHTIRSAGSVTGALEALGRRCTSTRPQPESADKGACQWCLLHGGDHSPPKANGNAAPQCLRRLDIGLPSCR